MMKIVSTLQESASHDRVCSMNILNELELHLSHMNKSGKIERDGDQVKMWDILNKIRGEIDLLVEDTAKQVEEYVSFWFQDGVPQGFTADTWLICARTAFDESGKPMPKSTTLHNAHNYRKDDTA